LKTCPDIWRVRNATCDGFLLTAPRVSACAETKIWGGYAGQEVGVSSFASSEGSVTDDDDAIEGCQVAQRTHKSSVTVSKSPELAKCREAISEFRSVPSFPHRWPYSRLPSDVSILSRPESRVPRRVTRYGRV
jgi:hypothetical protein